MYSWDEEGQHRSKLQFEGNGKWEREWDQMKCHGNGKQSGIKWSATENGVNFCYSLTYVTGKFKL